ncbi:YggT family protein [Evansella sp. AB-P1]|uniref:YggT family protein n=1 Tax=Evansella sp. AB-P1 TaxID=3037653 RepID=UPI002420180B|nr:YggT family protein [Evansella sp. AB-P1]MDG5788271.1 YggT family protein [Evansella sp. AB-P1]
MVLLHQLVIQAINIYWIICIIYIFMSWVPNARESSFGQLVGRLVEPYLAPFRKIIPPLGMIDISPIVAIFALRYAMFGVDFLFQMFY